MIRGLYTSGWSLLATEKKMDIITNNLANVDTNGYKKDTMVFQTFPDLLTLRLHDTMSPSNPSGKIGTMSLGSDAGEVFTFYTQGPVENTGGKLDIAIQGANNAFFTVNVPDQNGNARQFYTRDGSFSINAGGQLVTKDGYLVLGQNGPITLKGDDCTINGNGDVIQNGVTVGRLLIRQFADTTTLRKSGSNLVQTTQQTVEQPFTGSVEQGYLEKSNVNIVREMVDMISAVRAYEANQKLIQAQDGTLDRVVNEVGSIR